MSAMFGDYSSTFTIHNNLDAPLHLVSENTSFGYWLDGRNPQSLIGANRASEPIQLKDRALLEGTEGSLRYETTVNGIKRKIYIYVTCPWRGLNEATIKADDNHNLELLAHGWRSEGHPMIVDFTIRNERDHTTHSPSPHRPSSSRPQPGSSWGTIITIKNEFYTDLFNGTPQITSGRLAGKLPSTVAASSTTSQIQINADNGDDGSVGSFTYDIVMGGKTRQVNINFICNNVLRNSVTAGSPTPSLILVETSSYSQEDHPLRDADRENSSDIATITLGPA